ncbi:replication protein RepA [Asaia astilbis]|uniref:replication protein RepA n=1 Tax=Asaia astilbis TaxID=610244 RepID=UPI000472B6BA|nr:replication protein RepA [Asaia astilbis]
MESLHDIITRDGRQMALDLGNDRRIVDLASSYLAQEEAENSFLYTGFAYVTLPHRRIADDAVWQINTERASMVIQPGVRMAPDKPAVHVGVPYGSKARMIMLFLQTEALRRKDREVHLGSSLCSWLEKMGMSIGGKTLIDVRNQADRIARCRISFEFHGGDTSGLINQNVIDSGIFTTESNRAKFLDRVILSETFYAQLVRHPFPIDEAAIKLLSGHSQALDIYCWLSYRLHVLKKPTPISWNALKVQFGNSVGKLSHFKKNFLDNLEVACAVYPGAKVHASDTGLTLYPSRSPVQPKIYAVK